MEKEMITIKMLEDNTAKTEILQHADLSKIVGGTAVDNSKSIKVDKDGPYLK